MVEWGLESFYLFMFCAACGVENSVQAHFCLKCGAELLARCASCDAELPSGARFCPSCGQPARPATPSRSSDAPEGTRFVTGERKHVTILFADFSGFTAFSDKLDAEDVHDHMNSLWARLDGIVAAHGGTTEKHIGDAIMALFGARQSREEEPEQAVRAALAMQACISQLADGPEKQLQMRIGIHTGLVVLGPVGVGGQFTAMGDPVNLASRLEQSAPVGGVLISHETYRQVYGLFDVQGLPPLIVKGKPEPLETYLVLRAKPRALARQMRGVEGVETEMIGREPELKRLQSAFKNVIEARSMQICTVVGEAGIGKSCLLREFQKWIEPLPQIVRLFWGRATAEMAGLPFSLIRDVFFSRFEIQESDSPSVAREKLENGLVSLLGASAEAAGEESLMQAHFIGQLLGLDFSTSPYLRDILKDAEQIRHRAFHYLSRFFTVISQCPSTAERSPASATLLVAEDIHWSDDGTLDLIDYLARTCEGAPMIIVCLARSTLFERRPAWGEALPAHTRLNLEPLSSRDSRALVQTILRKAPEIPPALRDLIVGGAEGNPFYIEEIIKMLIDQKVIVPGAEHWRIEPDLLAATRVPPTLTGVLQARLDGLSPCERTVLQRASIVGRVFWDSAVERLGSPVELQLAAGAEGTLTKAEILDALSGLRRKELIFHRESSAFAGAEEYTFKHELLRNVTYESVLKKVRRDHHAQVAAWLIDHSGERITEFTGLVAAHLEQAGRPAQAAEWFGRAGQQARTGYAPVTAIEYFRKALALLPAERAEEKEFQAKRLAWHEGLAETLGAQANFADALEACASMRILAEKLMDLEAQARAFNGLAFLHERQGDNRASVENAERAEILAREAGEAGLRERIKALNFKGWAFYRLGDAPAVLALAEETLKLCTRFGDRRGMATSLKLHGVAHLQLGHYVEADRFFEQGLELCRELGDRRNAAAMWSNLGESARLRGDYEAAAGLYQKAIAISRQIGHRESEIIYLTNLSGARLGLRQFEQAEEDLRQVITLTGTPNSCVLSESYSFLSEACLGQAKLSEAMDAAQRALALAQQSGSYLDLGGAWRALGQAAAAMKNPRAGDNRERAVVSDLAEPEVCFAESLRVFKQMNAEGEQARTLRAWAEFEFNQGRGDEGRKKSEAARAMFLRVGAASEVARTEALLER